MTKIVATAGLVQVGHWGFWRMFDLHQKPSPPSLQGPAVFTVKTTIKNRPAELQGTLPRDSFISSNLQCQLLSISLCDKVSRTVMSERVSGDVTQFKQPSEEGKLRTALRALASTSSHTVLLQSPDDTLAPLPLFTDTLENMAW